MTRTLPDGEMAIGQRFATPEAGQRIGRYQLKTRIGAGGMGTVYLAVDPKLQRDVAIKLIRPERAGSEQARTRFVREARAMARIVHPNVVQVYDSGISEGRPFVVMELVRGTTLGGWLSAAPRSNDEILRNVLAAGQGLIAAHEAGLIHRDFKPANVLIGDDGRVRVSDFGLARALQESANGGSEDFEVTQPEQIPTLTCTGAALGSPVYMAPEQHHSDPNEAIDERTDQFAFAVTLFEALVGQRPFEATSAMGLLSEKLDGPPVVPTQTRWLRRHGPHLRRAMHPDRDQRFRSMRALLGALHSRRSLRGPVAAAVLTGGVGLLVFALVPEAERPCEVGRERMHALWGLHERGAVETALTDSGREHGSTTATKVLEQLDTRTVAWANAYAEACEGPNETLDVRMKCLEGQRERLSKTITTLKAGDPTTVDQAIAIASAGSMPARCLHNDEPADDTPPELRELAAEIRAEVRAAKRREHLGHGEQADTMSAAALQRARDLDYAPLLSFALTTRASALQSVGKNDAAVEFLDEAVTVAEAADRWKLVAAAHVEAVYLEGYVRGNGPRALRLARQAEAALARAGGDHQLEASLLNNLGATYHRMGDIEAACSAMAAALDIRQNNPGAYSTEISHQLAIVAAQQNVGACMLTGTNVSDALPFLESALETGVSVYGANNPELATMHQALSSAYESAGRYAEALEHIDKSIAFLDQKPNVPPAERAGAVAYRGYALSAAGRMDEAVQALLEAADLMEAARGPEDATPWAYRANAAEALVELGELDRASKLAETSLRRVLALSEAGQIALGIVQKTAGRVALAKGDPGKALEHYLAALANNELRTGKEDLANVGLHIDIARAHRAIGSTAAMLAALERAVELAAIEPHHEPIHSGEAYFELAKAVADDDADRARELAEQAIDIYRRFGEMPDRLEEARTWLAMLG
ncbi:MAG: protein kinase [Nannocystaceae bacterium]|nr:protein kinase [Nannocystaceae bacterium]